MFLQAMDYFASDPDTEVLVLVSKPPHPDTARKIYGRAAEGQAMRGVFPGRRPGGDTQGRGLCPASLEEAAQWPSACCAARSPQAATTCGAPPLSSRRAPPPSAPGYPRSRNTCEASSAAARTAKRRSRCSRALFTGLHSNISFGGAELLEDRYLSVENSLVDMGDEVFTKGRPHPVMDPSILVDRLIQEAHDPETGVILFDLLYGYAIHPDPVGAIEDALREVARIERDEGRHICLVASLCGTDIDPQNVAEQARRLREYGVVIQPSNARAALLAGLIVS